MKRLRIPPLAVGIGIYLPMSATFAVVVGAVVGHWYNQRAARMRAPERAERLGVLVASGMIVGESLFGVLNAGLIVGFSNDAPLALVRSLRREPLQVAGFVTLIAATDRCSPSRRSRGSRPSLATIGSPFTLALIARRKWQGVMITARDRRRHDGTSATMNPIGPDATEPPPKEPTKTA